MMGFPVAARAAIIAALCLLLGACTQTAVSSYNGDIGARSTAKRTTLTDTTRQKKILAARQRAAKKRAESRQAFLAKRQSQLKRNRAGTTAKATKETRKAKTTKRSKRKVAKATASRKKARKTAKSSRKNRKVAKGPKVTIKGKTAAFVGGKSRGISRKGKSWNCVPARLKKVLNQVSRKFGRVIVSSTHRSHAHNRKVGGKRRSYHLKCAAVDFKVAGKTRGLLRWLARHPAVGGYKRYRGTGHYHIDTGPKRTW